MGSEVSLDFQAQLCCSTDFATLSKSLASSEPCCLHLYKKKIIVFYTIFVTFEIMQLGYWSTEGTQQLVARMMKGEGERMTQGNRGMRSKPGEGLAYPHRERTSVSTLSVMRRLMQKSVT